MRVGINISIDVTKIDKAQLYQGKKGTYLDLTTFIDLDQKDRYDNNGFVTQSQTKEDRQSGDEKPPILGNVKVFYKDGQQQAHDQGMQQARQAAEPQGGSDFDDDIPF